MAVHNEDRPVTMPKLVRYLLATSLVAMAAPAAAQEVAEETAAADIIVTATKRSEALQDIPIAISVITAEELQQRNAKGFEDYLTSVPGVQFNYGGSQYTNSISIRGVTDLSGSALTQSPVALYLDEVPLTLSQGSYNLDYSVFGVENVLVIKGPHSALFGAASLGGTIKVETSKPSLTETRARAQMGMGFVRFGDVRIDAAATVETPIVQDKVGIGVTGYYRRHAGFIDDPSTGAENINEGYTYGGRAAIRLQPTEALTIDGTVYYQKHRKEGLDLFAPNQVGDLQSRPLSLPQFEDDEFVLGSLVVKYEAGFADIVSATSVYDRQGSVAIDLTNSFFNFGIPGATAASILDTPANVFSQELRLVSSATGPFKWLFGGFYSNERYDEVADISNSVVGALFSGPAKYRYITKAVFGEVQYAFIPELELTLGGRYTAYEADTFINFTGLFALPGPPIDRTDNQDDFSPRVALNYRFDAGSVYVQAAKGFRLGQANVPIVTLPGEVVPEFFSSDTLWNYEIGTKLALLDRRLNLDLAAYYIDWRDPQITLTSGTGFTYISNAGKVKILGFEAAMTARPTDSTTLTAAVAFNDAELAEDVPSVADKGARLPGVPRWTVTAGLLQDFMIGSAKSYARADYLYYGPYLDNFNDPFAPAAINGDYHRFDIRVGTQIGIAQFSIYATNLFDARPILTREFGYGGEDFSTIQPRTIGATFGFDF